ncbi:hypothetical protein KAK06_08635 [Ideonella sp. 4Y11]|uniref:Uncharacterized protein n=1 Tax=Ideonella aquatica TaxID=2824119 RepID=A0A941BQE6_9BURK|nr:hypothetical protein [Ideonella aquatica]MBQ0959025.1 hypothetical protein [Ideonella aquatica]
MTHALARLLLALLASAALMALGWAVAGKIGLLAATPVVAVLVTLPIQQVLGQAALHTQRLATEHALRGTRRYRDRVIGVIEDQDDHWWLRVDDLRRVLDGLPDTPRLLAATRGRSTPDTWRLDAHVRADALLELLDAAHARPTRQFTQWLRQEMAAEARRRERHR